MAFREEHRLLSFQQTPLGAESPIIVSSTSRLSLKAMLEQISFVAELD